MTAKKGISVKKLFDGSSYVNRYDLIVLEHQDKGLTEQRILLAFQALDELIPNLGVFTPIIQKLRKDLFEAVYSDEWTGAADNSKTGKMEYIQRVPYFSLVKQMYDERNDMINELEEQLDTVKKRLFDKNQQLEEFQKTIADMENHISVLNSRQAELKSLTEDKDKQIKGLENELEEARTKSINKEHQLDCDIADLKDALDEAKTEINDLSHFKQGYDNLYYAFMDQIGNHEDELKRKKKSVILTKRAKLLSSVKSAEKLKDQILTMMNTALEEYDQHIENLKTNLLERGIIGAMTNADLDLKIDNGDQELEIVQVRFQKTVSDLITELALLENHCTMLKEQLQKLEDIKPAMLRKKQDQDGTVRMKEEMFEELTNPFIPQERVFSKFSAMLYTSNNHGKTFEEFKDAKYCASCGEKTLLCPHKLSGHEKIFILPHNCSHIKITRPKVHISSDQTDDILRSMSPGFTLDSAFFVNHRNISSIPASPATVTSMESLGGVRAIHMTHPMHRLWEDYRKRTRLERTIPRLLSLEKTASLMEQFLVHLLWTDEFLTDEEANMSILDTFYCFMRDRYLVENVMFMAAYDFLSGVIEYGAVDKMIQLLGHVFVGNLDASCLRYVPLMCDLISAVDWKEVEDFRVFASVVYPFLNEDDLESLQMSYTSYSENRISSLLVTSFIIHIILKHREPRFQNMEKKLISDHSHERGQLSDREFKDAMDNLLPLCNERSRRRMYMQSERAVVWDGITNAVSITRLAQISGYLDLQQIAVVVKENVAAKVQEGKDPVSTGGSVPRPVAEVTYHQNASLTAVLTTTYIRQLALNMKRQAKTGNSTS